jgi:RNA polymerase sigma-70 factor (family 1)
MRIDKMYQNMEQQYKKNITNDSRKLFDNSPIPLNKVNQESVKTFELDDELYIHQALENNALLGFELLYKRYYQPMCSHVVKYVGSKEVAEDIVSDVFFQLYSNKTFFEIKTSYRLYLLKTVRNRAYNYLRWDLSRKADLNEASQKSILEDQHPDQISHFEELYQDVEEAISKLPVERRKIYLMQKFEGKKYQEIANELNLSVKTVDVQLTRANKFIRDLLKQKWTISIIIIPFISLIL